MGATQHRLIQGQRLQIRVALRYSEGEATTWHTATRQNFRIPTRLVLLTSTGQPRAVMVNQHPAPRQSPSTAQIRRRQRLMCRQMFRRPLVAARRRWMMSWESPLLMTTAARFQSLAVVFLLSPVRLHRIQIGDVRALCSRPEPPSSLTRRQTLPAYQLRGLNE